MIALVSDQRMQNIIPIFQKGASYNDLTLILSKERRTGKPHPKYEKAANDLKAVLGSRLRVSSSNGLVDPYNIEAIAAKISSLVEKYNGRNEVVINISGGTKPMAIGALQAAQKMGATCLYTNT